MKRFLAVLVLSLATSAAEVPSTLEWRDSARDVWIDGTLDRDAQVLSCTAARKLALLSPRLARAAVVDLEGKSVASAERSAFTFAKDHASATTPKDLATSPLCTCSMADPSTFLMSLEGKSVLIARHQGAVGEIGEETLFATVPVWRSLMESYTPDAKAVAALAKEPSGADVTVVLGTWCGDSKNYVPKLMKALHEAGNPRLKVKLVGLASRFLDPMELIQERRIINVPTVIVERGGRELGRIVETPAGASVEADLAAILAGAPGAHPGRWERKEKLASGTYAHIDASGKRFATEAWELYRAPEDGLLVHSAISGAEEVEVWHSVDRERRLDVLEVTKRKDGRLERARWFAATTRASSTRPWPCPRASRSCLRPPSPRGGRSRRRRGRRRWRSTTRRGRRSRPSASSARSARRATHPRAPRFRPARSPPSASRSRPTAAPASAGRRATGPRHRSRCGSAGPMARRSSSRRSSASPHAGCAGAPEKGGLAVCPVARGSPNGAPPAPPCPARVASASLDP